jgi:hypothetical protein
LQKTRYFCHDDLRTALYSVHNTTKQFGMEISPLKSKVLTCNGQVPIRSKITVDNPILKQVNAFTYFECKVSYEEEEDINFYKYWKF